MSPIIRANAAETDITPPIGTPMMEPPGVPTTGVAEPLYCRALVIDDGTTRVAIVTLDLLGLDLPLVGQIQEAIVRRSGVLPSHVMLTTTHNHSAPVTLDCGQDEARSPVWESELVAQIAACVAAAAADPVPVSLAFGRESVQIGVNRRVSVMGRTRMLANLHGPILPFVDVLRVDHADGRPLAVLFSHATHPVTVHTASTEFNADYPGFAAAYMREALGENVVPLFAQGCAGDINVESLAGGLDEAKRLGRQLGAAAVRAFHNATPLADTRTHVLERSAILPFDAIAPEMLDALQRRIRESAESLPAHDSDPRVLHDQRIFMRWVERVRRAPAGLEFRAQAIAFGDRVAVLGMTHELFAAYHLAIEAQSAFPHTMTFAYTNGCRGYIPTAEAYYLGGYEVDGAPKLFGLPRLLPSCESLVLDTTREVLSALFASSTRSS